MRIDISVNRPFHSVLMANSLSVLKHEVSIYSAAPRRYFSGLSDAVRNRFIPAPMLSAAYKLGFSLPSPLDHLDTSLFDRSVALSLGGEDLFIGWASQALYSARKAKRNGARFVLDRACPHRDFQDMLVARESERVGAQSPKFSERWRERQLEEYEMAEAILVPSRYTMASFPDHLQQKLIQAPLLGRCRFPEAVSTSRHETFTVGVVGGNPLRKGYLYLLQAWKKLALPQAELLIRTGDFHDYPALQALMESMPTVERVGYVADIAEFYQRCDVFVLPSVDDGFGMALIEAMANQRACIATTHCGASEIMTSGKDGIVVTPGDSDALAEAIEALYKDEELRQSMALHGAQTARAFVESRAYEAGMGRLFARLWPDTALSSAAGKPAALGSSTGDSITGD